MIFRSTAVVNTIFILATALATSAIHAEGFGDTSMGSETPDSLGGISKDEEAILSKGLRQQVQKFKKGRKTTGSTDTGSNRYSGLVEMHDENFDGVTDHGNADNLLEGSSEKSAVGVSGMPSGPARDAKLAEMKKKNCAKAKNPANCELHSISANIVDRGAAHAHDAAGELTEEHRIYELKQEAFDAAKKAGKTYADKIVLDASESTPDGVYTQKGSKANTLKVQSRNGVKEVTTAANIDLLRDEASKLEQIKGREVNNQWKYLRAKRLIDGLLGSLGGGSTYDPNQLRIAVLGRDGNSGALPNLVARSYLNADSEAEVTKYDGVLTKNVQQFIQTWVAQNPLPTPKITNPTLAAAAAKQAAIDQQNFNKNLADNSAKVQKCLKSGAWCVATERPMLDAKGQPVIDPTTKKPKVQFQQFENIAGKADPGNAFSDTREYIFNRVDQLNRNTTTGFADGMKNQADINAGTDAKTTTKPFQYMMDQAKENNQKVSEFLAREKEKERDGSYKSPYLSGKGYNAATMGAAQLSKRDLSRGDGSALGGIGQGNGVQVIPNRGGITGSGGYTTPPATNVSPSPSPASLGRNY